MRIWQCPGPTSFLNRFADALSDGNSVLLRSPPLSPDGIEEELSALLNATGWSISRIEDSGLNPVRQVLEACYLDDLLALEASPTTIVNLPALAGKVFWCVPKDSLGVKRWLEFIAGYTLAKRAKPEADCPRFILWLYGVLAVDVPVKSVGIEVLDLGEAISPVDLLLLAFQQTGSSIKSQVIAHTASAIALWDTELLYRLLDEDPDRLFEPEPLLKDYARELAWDENTSSCWEQGTIKKIGARYHIHSAKLACDDPMGIVQSRVWSGQAGVLLPVIERRRLDLIEQHKTLLKSELPFVTAYDTVVDISFLEIGPVYFLLRKRGASSSAQSTALRLKKARDSLAHLTPLTTNDAFATEITGE